VELQLPNEFLWFTTRSFGTKLAQVALDSLLRRASRSYRERICCHAGRLMAPWEHARRQTVCFGQLPPDARLAPDAEAGVAVPDLWCIFPWALFVAAALGLLPDPLEEGGAVDPSPLGLPVPVAPLASAAPPFMPWENAPPEMTNNAEHTIAFIATLISASLHAAVINIGKR
jgi:hypothetical protein